MVSSNLSNIDEGLIIEYGSLLVGPLTIKAFLKWYVDAKHKERIDKLNERTNTANVKAIKGQCVMRKILQIEITQKKMYIKFKHTRIHMEENHHLFKSIN